MRHILPVSLVVLLIAASCGGSGEKKILSVEKKIVLKQPAKVAVNREMSVDVAGMSCEHSCGGAIRMALKETGAVDRCSFDFKTDRKFNTAMITFDKDKISPDKIISIIQTINDGQFTTANPTTKTIEDNEDNEEASTSGTEATSVKTEKTIVKEIGVSSEAPSFEFPNLFELLASLVA